MAAGVQYLPDDGRRWQRFDEASRYASFLGSFTLIPKNTGVINEHHTVQAAAPPAGATPMIIPRKLVWTQEISNPNYSRDMSWARDFVLNADGRVTFRVDGDVKNFTNTNMPQEIFSFDVFSVAGSSALGSGQAGAWASDGSIFSQITDASQTSFVSWRGVVNVDRTWSIPQEVLNHGTNYVVFARWNDGGAVSLGLNRDSHRLETYTAFDGFGGEDCIGGSVHNIQLVIVSCGVSPEYPDSRVGMVIWNAQGRVTFSSKYPALQWRGSTYNFGWADRSDSDPHEVLDFVQPTGNVSQPMVPLCSLGLQPMSRKFTQPGASGWTFAGLTRSAFKMNGNGVSTSRGSGRNLGSNILTMYPTYLRAQFNLPCIDAADYF